MDEKEGSLIPTLRLENLAEAQLNASVFSLHQGEDQSIQSKPMFVH